MSTLTTTIARTLDRFRPTPTDEVHFHGGAHGPYVCEHAKCESPRLDPAEA
jgi:hypothetical protein